MLSTNQLKFLKWSNHINYMKEEFEMIDNKLEKIPDKKINIFEFTVHGRKFRAKE